MTRNFVKWALLRTDQGYLSFFLKPILPSSHVFVGPLSPGVVLIVKSCGTNISANVNCIRMKLSTISMWLQDYWKVITNSQSDPTGIVSRLILKEM